jgi:hypothetical protein
MRNPGAKNERVLPRPSCSEGIARLDVSLATNI